MPPWKRTIYILFFAQMVSSMGFSIIFPFLPLYIQELGTSTSISLELWVGIVLGATPFSMMFASPIWGTLADRYGRKIMIERAMFGGALIFILMSLSSSAEELALIRMMQGFITGVMSAITAMVVSVSPKEQAGQSLGIVLSGRWGGVAIGPFVGGIASELLGYQATFLMTSFLLTIAGTLVLIGVKEEREETSASVQRPRLLKTWRTIFARRGVKITYSLRYAVWLAQRTAQPFLSLFVAMLILQQTTSPLSDRIGTGTLIGGIYSLVALAGMSSSGYMGRLGDRVGHRSVLIGTALASASFYLIQAFSFSLWQLIIFQVLGGVAAGGLMPSLSALLNQYTSQGDAGAVYGLENSVIAAAGATASMTGAVIADLFGLRAVFFAAGVLFLFTTFLAIRLLPGKPQPESVPLKQACYSNS